MNNYKFLDLINTEIVKYKANDKYYVSFNLFLGFCDIFGYSIFIPVNDFISREHDGNEIYNFVNNLRILDNAVKVSIYLKDGTDDFIPGDNYFVSQSIADFIGASEEITMPDYLISEQNFLSQNYNDYYDLSEIYNKDIPNINYFINENMLNDIEYSIDDLNNFNSTFMKTILKYTTFIDYNFGDNAIYKLVIDFFANGSTDCALTALNFVNNYANPGKTTSTCGCATYSSCFNVSASTNTGTITTTTQEPVQTCDLVEEYKNAIKYYLKQMMSNPQFYCDWMNINLSGDNNIDQLIANEPLIDELIKLLELLKKFGYTIDTGNNKKYCSHFNGFNKCGNLYDDSNNICSQYDIINKYIDVLKIVKAGEINENINKIKIYGEQFADIFPYLVF